MSDNLAEATFENVDNVNFVSVVPGSTTVTAEHMVNVLTAGYGAALGPEWNKAAIKRLKVIQGLVKIFKDEAKRELDACRDDMPRHERYDKTARCEAYERASWLLESALNGK